MENLRRTGSTNLVSKHVSRIQVGSRDTSLLGGQTASGSISGLKGAKDKALAGVKSGGKKAAKAAPGVAKQGASKAGRFAGNTSVGVVEAGAGGDNTKVAQAAAGRLGHAGQRVGARGVRSGFLRPANAVGRRQIAAVSRSVRSSRGVAGLMRVRGLAGRRLAASPAGRKFAAAAGRALASPGGRAAMAVVNMARLVVMKIATALGAAVMSALAPVVGVMTAVFVAVVVISAILPSWVQNMIVDTDAHGEIPIFAIQDDYPWQHEMPGAFNTVNTETLYYKGNCTDFVFWRVNRDMGGGPGHWVYYKGDLTPAGGNGKEWGHQLPGWDYVDGRAQPGDIVSFQSGVYGHTHWAGHVAYVARVDEDGGILTENYGNAKYYTEQISAVDVDRLRASGGITIRRNPAVFQASSNPEISKVLSWAKNRVGQPYSAHDCCTFAKMAFSQIGVKLPMSTPGWPPADSKCENAMYSRAADYGGKRIPADVGTMKAGDLIFFQAAAISPADDNVTHVGIYLGDGKMIDSIPNGGVQVRKITAYGTHDLLLPWAVRVGE